MTEGSEKGGSNAGMFPERNLPSREATSTLPSAVRRAVSVRRLLRKASLTNLLDGFENDRLFAVACNGNALHRGVLRNFAG